VPTEADRADIGHRAAPDTPDAGTNGGLELSGTLAAGAGLTSEFKVDLTTQMISQHGGALRLLKERWRQSYSHDRNSGQPVQQLAALAVPAAGLRG
jgi:hypothetical protein